MPRSSETDRDGTMAAGAAQDVYTANQAPHDYVFFQNVSDTDMRIEFGADATSSKGRLMPANGGYYESPLSHVPAGKLSVYCASAGKAFVCRTV